MDLTDQQWHLLQPLFDDYDLRRLASPPRSNKCNPGSPGVLPEQSEASERGTDKKSILSEGQSPKSKDRGGRPPIQPRPILDGILWKIRNAVPWADLPKSYPSHQTCFRRYRLWQSAGTLNKIFHTLSQDLLLRGSFDLSEAVADGSIIVSHQDGRCRILASLQLHDTWQLSTSLVFLQLALTRLKQQSS